MDKQVISSISEVKIEGFKCEFVRNVTSEKVAYMIYPSVSGFSSDWLRQMAECHGVSIAMIYVPVDLWNDVLTPWAEPPEAKGFTPFAGDASQFYETLTSKIIPATDRELSLSTVSERDLIGVSLSGLFTLWQWLQHDLFKSIACLSGSFWYNGFIDWFDSQTIIQKTGKAYFLLGVDEPKAKIKAYHTVGVNTEAVVARLKTAGIDTRFDWVPGNHFSNPIPRAERAMDALFGDTKC